MPRDDPTAVQLGRAIMAARAERGLKRKELAEAADLSYPYVAEIENGGKQPSAKALQALARALGTSPSQLLARSEMLGEHDASTPAESSSDLADRSSDSTPLSPMNFADVVRDPSIETYDDELVAHISSAIADVLDQQLRLWLQTELPHLVRRELDNARGAGT